MTSLHRRLPAYLSLDPDSPMEAQPTLLGLHYSTARPLEVRLRLPVEHVCPGRTDAGGPQTYLGWSFDRLYLRASAVVIGGKFGIGDVQAGIVPTATAWLCHLRRGSLAVVVGTHPLFMQRFVADVERITPDLEPEVDVDQWIEHLLGAGS